ncbi:zinc-ribbon domain-containing protein [Parabacteroides distasonis]|uniref:zinc-ribbon domain-containing protein n=1 Tax=Parabacteroides distasonis TaxID=823 RepID=UPI001D09884B|nr:zinc-ribbon domain-containing protein [Parabacteroides distasonis]
MYSQPTSRRRKAALERAEAEERVRREAEEQEHSCPNCGAYNPEGTNFCQECGTRLTQPVQQAPAAKRFCPNCGTEVIAGHRFCSGCGTKME